MNQTSPLVLCLMGWCFFLLLLGWSACQPLFDCVYDNHCSRGMTCLAQQCQSLSSEPPPQDGTEDASESSRTETTSEASTEPAREMVPERPSPCVPTTETCNSKDDDCDGLVDEKTCGANAICVNDRCHDESNPPACNVTANCKADYTCVRQGDTTEPGICLVKCARDTDCPGHTKCMLSTCLLFASCGNDTECGEGRNCIHTNSGFFVCLPEKYECTNDQDCTPPTFCAVGRCVTDDP